MKRPRITIGGVMALLPVAAFCLAALRNPHSAIWASAMFTLTVLVLLSATLAASLGRGVAWGGFALFGFASLLLAFGPWRPAYMPPVPAPLAPLALRAVYSNAHGQSAPVPAPATPAAGGTFFFIPHAFIQTGSCLISLAVGGLGGALAYLFSQRPLLRPEPEPRDPTSHRKG